MEIRATPKPPTQGWEAALHNARLGLALSRAGRIVEARRVLSTITLPSAVSSTLWEFLDLRAQAFAALGDAEAAVEDLTVRLRSPTGETTAGLRLRPFWDPIRSQPAFQALLGG